MLSQLFCSPKVFIFVKQTTNIHTYRQTDRQTDIWTEQFLHTKTAVEKFPYVLYVSANCSATCLTLVVAWCSLLFTPANYSFGYDFNSN